jgi:hypothetical protein
MRVLVSPPNSVPCLKMAGKSPGKETNMSKIGRSAISGRFTTVKTAQTKPNTHVVETIKPPKK